MKIALVVFLSLALAVALLFGPDNAAGCVLAAGTIGVDLSTIGFTHAAGAYTDDKGRPVTTAPLARVGNHHYHLNHRGELEHSIDGVLRATVPPDGMESYVELWPDCAPLVKRARAGAKGAQDEKGTAGWKEPGDTPAAPPASAPTRRKARGRSKASKK